MRMTTTAQINNVLQSNLAQVAKAEVYNKDSKRTDIITDAFLENFQFLCEAGCFTNRIGWHYERCEADTYIIETGRTDGNSENIISAYLRLNDGASIEGLEKMLLDENVA